jgi:hypothetical protein
MFVFEHARTDARPHSPYRSRARVFQHRLDYRISFVPGEDETALRYRYDEGGDDGAGPVPRPRGPPRHLARDVPSRPATVLGIARVQQLQHQQQERHDARERAQPTKLDLFRSCSDTDAAAVDLEADIPPAATVVSSFQRHMQKGRCPVTNTPPFKFTTRRYPV